MPNELSFTREDSDRLVRLEQQNLHQTQVLTQILEEAKKTNGRITRAEEYQNKQKGVVSVISILGGFIGATITAVVVAIIKGH